MLDTKEQEVENLQITIMKMMAEQNHEKFLEYDCASDTATLSVVRNGHILVKERIPKFLSEDAHVYAHVAEEDKALYSKELKRCLKRPTNRVFDIRFVDDKEEKKWYRIFLVSIGDKLHGVTQMGLRIVSIHKEKMAADMLRMQAERDSLTGVYNHKAYENLSRELIQQNSDGVLFLMIDIDNFKQINDTNGHYVGDSIIKQVGDVLLLTVKGFGIAGRTGGDEFSVTLANIWDKETAISICMRIKDALKKSQEGVTFSVSIGAARSAGRVCTYEELFFEADEALYFVKENGKNQIAFSEDLNQKKQEIYEEKKRENSLSEEEIVLNQRLDCCVVVDPANKNILYANQSACQKLGASLEEFQKLRCYELLRGRCEDCEVCELYTSRVHALTDSEAGTLKKYVPDGKFIIQSRYITWKGEPARINSILDINDEHYMESYFIRELESNQMLSKCWNMIHDLGSENMDYSDILRVLNEYYDADCSVIITKSDSEYKDVFEYHRNSAEGVIEGIYESVKEGIFSKMEVLIDEDGYMRRHHIEKKLLNYPELAEELEKKLVHNTLGMKLARQDDFVGILLIINARHHTEDYYIIKRMGVFFATDLQRKRLSDKKNYEASHDMLTKLWSRTYFGEWQASFGPQLKKNYGVFTSDILHLGKINQEFGYNNGDARLVDVANLFKRVFAGYNIFRYDMDEILAVCHNTDKEDFQKLVSCFKEQMEELNVELSIGYSWTADGDLGDVIREAHVYLEKDKIRLESSNNQEGKLLKRVEQDVLKQIALGNFRVFLQPKFSISSGKNVGGEALIRLYDEVRGFVSPAFFIPILEQRGAIHLVDLFVLEEVFKFQKTALEEGRPVVPISVNFSKNTLVFKGLMERIRELCDAYPIPNGLIQIEITETISSMDHIIVNEIATSLRNMGFSVSMDDFGTKYSNMAVLTQFEFDTVKIDRSLLLDVERNAKNKTVLKHTLEMLKDLDMETVMEGVETAEQVEILRDLGCDTVQGYFYGRPEPMEKFYELFM